MRYEKSIKKFTDKSSKKTNKIKQIGKDTRQAVKKFLSRLEKKQNQEKSLVLGFATVLGIFGVTLFTPVLTAAAKDLPTNQGQPS